MWTNDFNREWIGFDAIMDRVAKTTEQATKMIKYPPYNLKKIDENRYLIEMAVAGFSKQDIEVELADDKLIIRGNTSSDETETDSPWPVMLHQGLATRPFTRTFALNDNIEIKNAELVNGILRVALEAFIPEHKKPKKIEVVEKNSTKETK